MKPTHQIGIKTPYCISTASFDKAFARPLDLVQVLAPPLYDIIRRLNKSEESFEHALESIRDRLNLLKMGSVFDAQLRCKNPRLFNTSAKSLSFLRRQRDSETVRALGKDEVANGCVAKG